MLINFEKHSRPERTHGGCWTFRIYINYHGLIAVSDRTRQLYFNQETIKIILRFDMHKWRTDFSLVLCIIHVWTESDLLIINIHVTEPHRECTLIVRYANTNFRNAI